MLSLLNQGKDTLLKTNLVRFLNFRGSAVDKEWPVPDHIAIAALASIIHMQDAMHISNV